MGRPRTLWEHLRWDLLVLTIVVLGVGGYFALQDPRMQPADSPLSDGSKPPDRTEGDVLLVFPTAPAAQARDFETLDCGFTWFNALRQHFGTFATASADDVTAELLAGHSVVVLPARVASEIPTPVRDELEEFARQGGQLIVEMPRDPGWESATGVSTGDRRAAGQFTAADGLPESDPLADHLVASPLFGDHLRLRETETVADDKVLVEIDGEPGLVAHRIGDGRVFSVLFDFACTLTAIHQGKPTTDLVFGPPDGPQRLPTADRVATEDLVQTDVPYAAVLQRSLFERISEDRPVPRLWPFPADYRGAAMSTHPSPTDPRPAFAFADRAHDRQASSTIVAAPDRFTGHHAAMADQIDAQVGLMWVLGQRRSRVTEGVGVGAIQPWRRELTLPRQKAMLSSRLSAESALRVVQTEDLLWDRDWDSTFRALAAAELDVDTSFGPTTDSEYGYLFGTGMPFYPLDTRGRPLPIQEMPFVLGGANLTTERLQRLFEGSDELFHQPVAVNLAADAMERTPSVGLLLGYRNFHDLARDHDHWLTTAGDYTEFLAARRQSVMTSQWSGDDRRLTVSVNLTGIRLATAPDGAVASVAIPADYDGGVVDRIDVDDDDIDVDDPPASGSGDERLVELPPGRHVVTVHYHSPSDES